jgi:hypothetical protein
MKEVVIRILVDDHATTDDIGESLFVLSANAKH